MVVRSPSSLEINAHGRRYYKELRREENNVKKLRLATREVEDLSARHASTMATVRERLEAVGVVSGGDSIGALRGATRAAQVCLSFFFFFFFFLVWLLFFSIVGALSSVSEK